MYALYYCHQRYYLHGQTVMSDKQIVCPYCGSENWFIIFEHKINDSLIQDCGICCNPIVIKIIHSTNNEIELNISKENE